MSSALWKKKLIHIGSVATSQGLSLITQKQSVADVVELRFDALYARHYDAVARVIAILKKRQTPVLLTLRTRNEGGARNWKSTERIRLFKQLLPYADAVDFELANLPLLKEPLRLARKLNKKVILSAHAVRRKITYKRGADWLSQFRQTRADFYKIATFCRTQRDLNVLVKLLINHPELRLAVMAVGPLAKKSRQVLPLLGSRLVYGYLDAPVAKGQPALTEIRSQLT
ncbi:MAG: type I 3-dehydroquinate dehydratase [Verrucomicrobiales bacterium]|jgi:3-dehydroquinate dehydratase-1|nr:type I 3-dehydroquinate dehydratase [Verrucomicrobiales bacterium]